MVNTGRMAEANTYSRSPACQGGGVSVQNVSFLWANGKTGLLNTLIDWADGCLLLLVFGPLAAAETQRLRQLTATTPLLRVVQVIEPGARAQAREHLIDAQGHLRRACQATGQRWALVRPDSYLAGIGAGVDGALVAQLGRALTLI
jgi:3-(3-hydroxy-phenyl)propionate hydroxylase